MSNIDRRDTSPFTENPSIQSEDVQARGPTGGEAKTWDGLKETSLPWKTSLEVQPSGRAASGTEKTDLLEARFREGDKPMLNLPKILDPDRWIRVAAHRGNSDGLPENSLAAFKSSMSAGVEYIEADVHHSSDKHVVIIHDAVLDRTTDGTGYVQDHTLEELEQFHLLDADGAVTEETLPELEALLECMDDQTYLLLEIKHPNPEEHYENIEEQLVDMLRRHDRLSRTLIISFDIKDLERVRERSPTLMLGGLLGDEELAHGQALDEFFEGLRAVSATLIGVNWPLLNDEVARKARAADLQIAAWTVDDLEVVDSLQKYPLDLIISNRSAEVRRHLSLSGGF